MCLLMQRTSRMVIVHPGGLLGAFFVCPITFPEAPRSGVSDFHHGLQFRSLLLGSGIGAYMYPHTCITIQPTTQRCSRCFSFPHGSSEAVDCLQICHSLSKDPVVATIASFRASLGHFIVGGMFSSLAGQFSSYFVPKKIKSSSVCIFVHML